MCTKLISEQPRATESYGELWVPMAKQGFITLIFYLPGAMESYGEVRGVMGKKLYIAMIY